MAKYLEKNKQKRCILRLNDSSRINFDLFVMLFATWNCFAIPFEIAFEPEIAQTFGWILFNTCIDFFFLIDIVITFRTTYLNSSGDEISDPKMIRN